jgi:hypothetical protein
MHLLAREVTIESLELRPVDAPADIPGGKWQECEWWQGVRVATARWEKALLQRTECADRM